MRCRMLPGVLQDSTGQLHVDGASTRQVYDQIDGFNVSDPATGQFLTRVSVDALRSADVASSRYSTEFGKSSGGVISLRTGTGDDHWRVTGTDFFPGVQDRRGINVNNWTPRAMASGPIRKGKAWFMDALEGEYDQTIYTELPANADRSSVWRASNLSKVQMNLAQNNNLTVSLLLNSLFSPAFGTGPARPDFHHAAVLHECLHVHRQGSASFPERHPAGGGRGHQQLLQQLECPWATQTYVVTPNGTSGNYYLTQSRPGRAHGGNRQPVFATPARGGKTRVQAGC